MRHTGDVNAHWRLDLCPGVIYLTRMLRKLLALLVLVTGLAAAGQPAQAMVLKVDSVQAIEAGALRWPGCAAQAKPASTACTLSTLSTIACAG